MRVPACVRAPVVGAPGRTATVCDVSLAGDGDGELEAPPVVPGPLRLDWYAVGEQLWRVLQDKEGCEEYAPPDALI